MRIRIVSMIAAMTLIAGSPVLNAEVPWMTLPNPDYAYCPPGPLCPSSPYVLQGSAAASPDNPASISSPHANITRHWTSPPEYKIVVPPNLNGDMSKFISTSFPGLGTSYRWSEWIDFVQRVFDRYASIETADISAIYTGTIVGEYRNSQKSFPAGLWGESSFIWAEDLSNPATSGPTGNGVNEIIFTNVDDAAQTLFFSGGLASMLVDPQDGRILECDILVSAATIFAGYAADSVRPEEWTALPHEVGHFFGLDHTNLHSGQSFESVFPTFPLAADYSGLEIPVGQTNKLERIYKYPVSDIHILDDTNNIVGLTFPDTVGLISWIGTGFSNEVDISLLDVHPDDAVALSKIYPVAMPSPPQVSPKKTPLINKTARIIGRQLDTSDVGMYGSNHVVVPEGMSQSEEAFPFHGTLSSTARLSVSDGDQINSNWPFLTGTSLLGFGGTGDFSLDGLPAGTYDDENPVAYEMGIERISQGLFGGRGNFGGEWNNDFPITSFYTGNPLSASLTNASRFLALARSDVGAQFGVQETEIVSGLRVVPGSVVALDPAAHGEAAIQSTSSGFNGTSGLYVDLVAEPHARPLVDIQPRDGRWGRAPVTIRARVTQTTGMDPAFGLDLSSATLHVDGNVIPYNQITTVFPSALIGLQFQAYPFGTVRELTITIPMRDFVTMKPAEIGPPTPGIETSFMIDLVDINPNDPYVPHVAGRNDVIF